MSKLLGVHWAESTFLYRTPGPPPGNFESTEIDAYQAALELNLLSVVAMCKTAVPFMRKQRWG